MIQIINLIFDHVFFNSYILRTFSLLHALLLRYLIPCFPSKYSPYFPLCASWSQARAGSACLWVRYSFDLGSSDDAGEDYAMKIQYLRGAADEKSLRTELLMLTGLNKKRSEHVVNIVPGS